MTTGFPEWAFQNLASRRARERYMEQRAAIIARSIREGWPISRQHEVLEAIPEFDRDELRRARLPDSLEAVREEFTRGAGQGWQASRP